MPSVFDYPTQALLYQPALPAYDWKNKDAFYGAASAEIRRLLEVSRGRALCLFTSWGGLQAVNEHLADPDTGIVWPLRAQGDAPRDALLRWFRETPHSVLLATKSFWEGVDIPGDDLSLVILDKMPFPTPSDPLHAARMETIDAKAERASFGEYMLPLMTLALKQGFGRLIRRTSDRGVVAILDERLSSKGYGRQARTDLPPARFSREIGEIHRFFRAALDSQADFALNVSTTEGDQPQWRWELVRLQDGRADGKTGRVEAGEAGADLEIVGELTGIFEGLRDLRRRIEQAGRAPEQFGVEVRCSQRHPGRPGPARKRRRTHVRRGGRERALAQYPDDRPDPRRTERGGEHRLRAGSGVGGVGAMDFTFRPFTDADARTMLSWRYPPPLDLYNINPTPDNPGRGCGLSARPRLPLPRRPGRHRTA